MAGTGPSHFRDAWVGCALALIWTCAGAAQAESKAPTPEFAVKSIFEEHLARRFAQKCKAVEFDHAGHDRHIRKRLAGYSDRGVQSRDIFRNFAPIQTSRYRPHIARFNARYGLDQGSSLGAFCAAAVQEARARTALGQMLKLVDKP